jgi:hypothetical protein
VLSGPFTLRLLLLASLIDTPAGESFAAALLLKII